MKVKPCPCCGSDKLYIGTTSALTQGVVCLKCFLRIDKGYPKEWDAGVDIDSRVLKRAIKAWNKRVEVKE